MNPQVHRDLTREALAESMADHVWNCLKQGLKSRDRASMVVPGGTTPGAFFRVLRSRDLDWSRVIICPSDERWVAPDDDRSNERLILRSLLQGPAKQATFISLITRHPTPAMAIHAVTRRIAALPSPLDVVVLGMGVDGHFASLFPHQPAVFEVQGHCQAAMAPSEPIHRISLSLNRILDAREICLLFFGEEKWQVYQTALDPGDRTLFPVRAILHQDRVPVHLFFSS